MMTDGPLIHRLDPAPEGGHPLPEKFNNPFRYTPDPATIEASTAVLRHIVASEELTQAFSEGKMLGVLIVRDKEGNPGFLAGFSGLAGGKSVIPYFVPPLLDLTDPQGHFRKEEAEIDRISLIIKEKENSQAVIEAARAAYEVKERCEERIRKWKERMRESKSRRDAMRRCGADGTMTAAMARESQFEKAELKRIMAACRDEAEAAEGRYRELMDEIGALKKERQERSERLQRWISENMVVENAAGERKSVWQIFSDAGAVPPGGTGECAAPKLLHYAYTHGLEPVAMGEFWYGESRGQQVRQHGRFYPSCTGKCGPLLGFMMQGLDVEDDSPSASPPVPARKGGAYGKAVRPLQETDGRTSGYNFSILYEDNDIIVADKPSGILSVPGRTGERSLQEILSERLGANVSGVHRLDMDTSGIIVYAKNPEAHRKMQRQFEKGEVRKEYIAIIDTGKPSGGTPGHGGGLEAGSHGTISLPIAPDYHDRPRQKVDFMHGKEAETQYSITASGDGWAEVLFRPLTGRTHQLRVHAAHPLGLGAPIKGDRLYGSAHTADRLCLHASMIKFRHPVTGCPLEFKSRPDF